jgi:predicted metalloprotease with PDZ domain
MIRTLRNPTPSWTLALSALALVLAVALPAFAGGEKCKHDGKTKAAHAEKIAHMKHAGWSGIEAEKGDAGYVVTAVHPASPAAEAGVRKGDRLVAYQGIELAEKNKDKLKQAKKSRHVGARVSYTLERDDRRYEADLVLAEVPDTVLADWAAELEAQETLASVD